MKHHRFNVDEVIAALVLSDDPSSTTGVTNGLWYPVRGIQTFGYQVTPQTEKLITEGLLRAQESTIDDVPITLELGQFDGDIDALLTNAAAWYDASGNQNFAVTDDFGNALVSLKVRIKKTGINNADVVYTVPKVRAVGLDRSGQQRNFAPNKFTTSALFTDSTYPVYKNGVAMPKSICIMEQLRIAGSALYSVVSTTPTVTSVGGSSSGTLSVAAATFNASGAELVFAIAMNPNSINDLTIVLLDNSSALVPCTVTPTGTGVDENKKFTIKPKSTQATGNYSIKALSAAVRSMDGVKLASDFTKAVTLT